MNIEFVMDGFHKNVFQSADWPMPPSIGSKLVLVCTGGIEKTFKIIDVEFIIFANDKDKPSGAICVCESI